jgi:hypothetical protein
LVSAIGSIAAFLVLSLCKRGATCHSSPSVQFNKIAISWQLLLSPASALSSSSIQGWVELK